MSTRVTLTVSDTHVTIPYPAAPGGDAPHAGFVVLKGDAEGVDTIPAARESEALRLALGRINAGSTPFFTVACRSAVNRDEGGHWVRGYLEFALNYEEVAKDSPNYFLLFEQFAHHAKKVRLDLPVDFSFELHPATFSSTGAEGYTACVWITTAQFAHEDAAVKAWNQSIGFLAEFLGSYETLDIPEIYQA